VTYSQQAADCARTNPSIWSIGTTFALFNGKRNEVSSFPSFPPPTNPVRYPP